MYKILSRPDCIYCTKAKQTLVIKGIEYEETLHDTQDLIDAFKSRGFKTFPQIYNEDEYIGGYTDLVEYLNK